MASKKKKNRRIIALECVETGMRAYITEKNVINTTDKIELMKFNSRLRKHTLHKEIQKLK
jgi:large subunit ribosomal protein L33